MEQKEVCEKVVRILNMVLESCQDKLSRTLTNSLPDLSSRMLAKGLISHSVKESGGFDQIMQEFQSGWGFSDSVYDLEEQCFKFLNTLCDMRGAPAKAAKKLEKDWSKEVEKQLTDITFLRRQKNKKSHSTPVNVVAIRPNINRKSYSETHSHGTSMESHHNHHDTDSTQPFTSDIENLKRDQVFLDSIEETVSTDSFKTEDIYVPGEEEQDLQTRSTINLSSPPNLLVPGQTKHQPSSLTFSQLQSEYSGHPVTTTSSHNSIPVTDSSTTFQPPPAISHGPFQEERLEQGMELEVVTPKQATIQTESQSKSANSQPLSSAHSSCSEYIQHLKDENQTLAAEKERFEKKKDKSEKAFVTMLKRDNRELKKQVSELLKERRDQDEREKDMRRRETLLYRKEEQIEERQKQQDQREEKHDDKNQKRKMHREKQDEELDQRYTNLGIQKKKLNLLRSQLDQKRDELKTKEQELKDEKDKVKRKKNHLTVLIILVVILLVVPILIFILSIHKFMFVLY